MPSREPNHTGTHASSISSKRRNVARLVGTLLAVSASLVFLPAQSLAASNTVSAQSYIHSVCTTLTNFEDQAKSLEASANIGSSTSLSDVRFRLVNFLNQIVGVTNSSVTDLQNAGIPKVKNGNKIAALISMEITNLRDAFAQAGTSAQALPTDDPTAFQQGAQTIDNQISAAGKNAQKALDDAKTKYKTSSLNQAEARDPACKGLK